MLLSREATLLSSNRTTSLVVANAPVLHEQWQFAFVYGSIPTRTSRWISFRVGINNCLSGSQLLSFHIQCQFNTFFWPGSWMSTRTGSRTAFLCVGCCLLNRSIKDVKCSASGFFMRRNAVAEDVDNKHMPLHDALLSLPDSSSNDAKSYRFRDHKDFFDAGDVSTFRDNR